MSGLVKVSVSRDLIIKSQSRSRFHETQSQSLGLCLDLTRPKMKVSVSVLFLRPGKLLVSPIMMHHCFHFIFSKTFWVYPTKSWSTFIFFSGTPVHLHTNIYLFVLANIHGAFHYETSPSKMEERRKPFCGLTG